MLDFSTAKQIPTLPSTRVFKTAWFTKAANKAHISDDELCSAIQQIILGKVDYLGGGVFKKRLNKNRHRSIILAKSGCYWVFQYMFAKQDRDNINAAELASFRDLVKSYQNLSNEQLAQLISNQDFVEICHDNKKEQI